MDNDTERSLGDIFPSSQAFISKLCGIQELTIGRKDAIQWAQKLRLLRIPSSVEFAAGRKRKRRRLSTNRSLRLFEQGETADDDAYLAISYPCDYTDWSTNQTAYEVTGSDGEHTSKVNSKHFDRAVSFARAHRIRYIWIDQECIDQSYGSRDQSLGIQAMDLVYRNAKRALGLLGVTIEKQEYLDALKVLFQTDFTDPDVFSAEAGLNIGAIVEMVASSVDISGRILCRKGYVFVNPYASADGKKLRSDTKMFGSISGELQIPAYRLKQAATHLSLACGLEQISEFSTLRDVVARLKQYNLLNSLRVPDHSGSQVSVYRSSTHYVLEDLVRHTECQYAEDLLAMAANCLKYSERLDTYRCAEGRYSLSACIVTLCCMNGEVFVGDRKHLRKEDRLSQSTALDYLDRHLFDRFQPPGTRYQTSSITSYRLSDVHLTEEGTETEGWLWAVQEDLQVHRYKGRDPRGYLIRLLKRQNHHALAGRLSSYDPDATGPSAGYREKMFEAVVEFCLDPKPGYALRPAYTIGDGMTGSSCALFICRRNTATNIFTSCSDISREHENNIYGVYKTVSLGVGWENPDTDETARLYPHDWINGLWFSSKDFKKPAIIPWNLPSW
ncbi:hypothetical protein H2203_004388 [Taxawa tesnikishii (nom. ined.)]|nr:hypothetical protein H2203_004388 [Dothideales sp. JES 119]